MMAQTTAVNTLSEREAFLLSKLAAAGMTTFTIEQARQVSGLDAGDVARLLHRLSAKLWLRRLERGKYRLIPLDAGPGRHWAEHEYLIGAALVQPYYLAYGTALNFYGYGERQPRPVWIATTRRKRTVTVEGITYRFVTLSEHKFFGYTSAQLMDGRVNVAKREKAIADGFDHPEYCGGIVEVGKALWLGADELNLELLVDCSRRLRNRTAMRRLGFWLDRLNMGDEEILQELVMTQDRNYAPLDPAGPDDGPIHPRWRLIVNVPQVQLLEWMQH